MANDILMSLLSPEQRSQAQEDAFRQGLLGLSQGLIRAAIPQGGRRTSTLEALALAAPGAVQSYRGSFDQTLKDLLTNMQVKDMMAKKQREQQIQKIAGQLFQPQQGMVPTTIPTETYEDYKTTVPGITGVEINKSMLPALGALGPEGMDYATRLMQFQKSMQPEERVLKPGDIVTRGGEVIFQAPAEFKGYEKVDLGNTIAFVDPRDPTKVVGQMSKSKDPKELGSVEDTVRKEYLGQAKPYIEVGQAYKKVAEAAKNPSAAGDIAMIFGFMKILDPGSVVREGEFATAQNAAGIPDRVRAQYNAAINGQRLTDVQRTDFMNQAKNIVQSQRDNFNSTIKPFYEGIVKDRQLNQSNVLFDPFKDIDTRIKPVKPSVSTPKIPSIDETFNKAAQSGGIKIRQIGN
jgi:hypothetical protein